MPLTTRKATLVDAAGQPIEAGTVYYCLDSFCFGPVADVVLEGSHVRGDHEGVRAAPSRFLRAGGLTTPEITAAKQKLYGWGSEPLHES
jgi:hypothetical protein